MVTVRVDETLCSGHGNCALVSPEVFELDEEVGKSRVLDATPPADLTRWVVQAAQQCPTQAIVLTDFDTDA